MGRQLQRLRLRAGLTQSELAKEVGLTRDRIKQLEAGPTYNMLIGQLLAIQRALKVSSLEEFFGPAGSYEAEIPVRRARAGKRPSRRPMAGN